VQASQVKVYDNTGRLAMTLAQQGTVINLSAMPAGLYLLKIAENGDLYSARVVKE